MIERTVTRQRSAKEHLRLFTTHATESSRPLSFACFFVECLAASLTHGANIPKRLFSCEPDVASDNLSTLQVVKNGSIRRGS